MGSPIISYACLYRLLPILLRAKLAQDRKDLLARGTPGGRIWGFNLKSFSILMTMKNLEKNANILNVETHHEVPR